MFDKSLTRMQRARLVFYIYVIPSWCSTTFSVMFIGVVTGTNPLKTADQFIPSYCWDAVRGLIVFIVWELIDRVRKKPESIVGQKTPKEINNSE